MRLSNCINRMAILPVFIGCVFVSCNSSQQTKVIVRPIDQEWDFKQVNGDFSGKAIAPSTIHTDLLAANLIEDPFYRTNEKDLQWIDKEDWEYKTAIIITQEELKKEQLRLFFEGLDTYADVYFNNVLLLEADNMFREWEIDIKPYAVEGNNELRVYFHSPVKKGLEKYDRSPYAYPAVNDQSENGGLGDKKISVFSRKAGYHYGWDWGPRFVTSGIWRAVYLKAWDQVRINNVYIKQPEVNEKLAKLIVDVTYESNTEFHGKLVLSDKAGNKKLLNETISFKKGINTISLPFSVSQPKLWWSNGLGEPHLYDFEVELIKDNALADAKTITTGLRSIRLLREQDEHGESFLFELNGVRVFMKGANYIPNDNFLTRVTKADYEKVIADAVNANMNMLRVWGGGIYENKIFYDLCDRNGILVWQDFMFACSMYPGDEAFLQNVKQEAIDNVKRLRNHPCIALWCGNNEINTAWNHYSPGGWGWKERYTAEQREEIQQAYLAIFHDILPKVVNQHTVGTDYWPSSPQAGYEPHQHATYSSNSGDMHYWGVWHGLHPFEDFDVYKTRFMSEYGFQSFPDFETVQTYTIPSDYDIESEVMAAHQRSGIGNLRIKEYMSWYFNVPSNFEDFLYMSQVLQAYGMKKGIEAHRRAMPYCMGTLYWQINDCWPVASWSSTDYYRKWKAMHYAVKHAYEPLVLSLVYHDGTINVFAASDLLMAINGQLELTLMDFDGKVLWEKKTDTEIVENTATLLSTINAKEMLPGFDPNESLLLAKVTENGAVKTSNVLYFAKPKNQKLPAPSFEAKVLNENGRWIVEIGSDKLARAVYLNFPDQNEFFADNYFDLLPGQKRRIEVANGTGLSVEKLMIKHLQQIQ